MVGNTRVTDTARLDEDRWVGRRVTDTEVGRWVGREGSQTHGGVSEGVSETSHRQGKKDRRDR